MNDDLTYWTECEKVAMHFNDLLIQLRFRALGGVAALISIAAATSPSLEAIGWVLAAMSLVWLSILEIDLGYYSLMLKGAVREIHRVERESGGRIQLSTEISRAADRVEDVGTWSRWVVLVFHGGPMSCLVAGAVGILWLGLGT